MALAGRGIVSVVFIGVVERGPLRVCLGNIFSPGPLGWPAVLAVLFGLFLALRLLGDLDFFLRRILLAAHIVNQYRRWRAQETLSNELLEGGEMLLVSIKRDKVDRGWR